MNVRAEHKFVDLTNARVLARGSERICYLHPEDPGKCIKVAIAPGSRQQQRELQFFRRLARRGGGWQHIPRFHGTVDTSLGTGLVVSRVRDYDGATSADLDSFIQRGETQGFPPALEQLKACFRERNIITCDMSLKNFLVRRLSPTTNELVMVDGLGNREFIPLASWLPAWGRMKMKRRWKRFDRKLSTTGSSSAISQH